MLALVIEEQITINGSLFGATEQNVRQCIFGQKNIDKLWDGLPVMIHFGDNYQLQNVEKDWSD